MKEVAVKKVAVVYGGISGEREISIASGKEIQSALTALGHQTYMIDAGYDLAARLLALQPDVIFNALHGTWGESGQVQGLFESLNIPYTHSGVLASALAMDKEKAKVMFAAAGLPLAQHIIATPREAEAKHLMVPPYVVKPIAEGSSLGVFIVPAGANAPPEALATWQWGARVMVEEYIPGREFSCAVLNNEALGVAEIIPEAGKFYDYKQKYDTHGAKHAVPAKVNQSLTKQIEEISLTAYQILGCKGAARCDLRYNSKTNQLALLEINTQPGMTSVSLVPEIAHAAGMDIKHIVQSLIEDALHNKQRS